MDFITQTLNGLGLGSIYALVALGYSMVYGIVQLINFAHGDIIMVGGYVLYLVLVNLGEARGHEIALVAESIRCYQSGQRYPLEMIGDFNWPFTKGVI